MVVLGGIGTMFGAVWELFTVLQPVAAFGKFARFRRLLLPSTSPSSSFPTLCLFLIFEPFDFWASGESSALHGVALSY